MRNAIYVLFETMAWMLIGIAVVVAIIHLTTSLLIVHVHFPAILCAIGAVVGTIGWLVVRKQKSG